MRNLFIRFCRFALGIIAAMTGVAFGEINFMKCEYGTPHADFEIKGRVTDVSGTPIKGIAVTVDETYPADSAFTAADGTYILRGGMFPQKTITIAFDDIDGELNGGKFSKETLEVGLKKLSEGSGNWDYGDYGAENADMKLSLEE